MERGEREVGAGGKMAFRFGGCGRVVPSNGRGKALQ